MRRRACPQHCLKGEYYRLRYTPEGLAKAKDLKPASEMVPLAKAAAAQLASGQTDDAITSLKRSVDLAPWYTIAVGSLASAYHRAGDQERAREWAQRLAVSHGHSVGMARYYATTVAKLDVLRPISWRSALPIFSEADEPRAEKWLVHERDMIWPQ